MTTPIQGDAAGGLPAVRPRCLQDRVDRPVCRRLRRGAARSRRDSRVLREEPPMPEKCVTCGLLFRTSNELDWHIREEHTQRAAPPPRADGGREPDANAVEPPGRPRWLSAARRLFGRRPPEPPSGQGRGGA